MSFIMMAKAMKLKVGSPYKKLILLKLADNANDEGFCWPSLNTIAEQCEIHRATVIRNIKALEDEGYLEKTVRRVDERLNKSNMYQLRLEGSRTERPPSSTVRPGVVAQCDPNLSIEPIKESKIGDESPRNAVINPDLVVEKYNEILGKHYPREKKIVDYSLKKLIVARHKEGFDSLQDWVDFFYHIKNSEFLMGKVINGSRKPFQLSLEWLVKKQNLIKIVEGAYHG